MGIRKQTSHHLNRVVGGPFEAKGKIPENFDTLHEDLWLGQDNLRKGS